MSLLTPYRALILLSVFVSAIGCRVPHIHSSSTGLFTQDLRDSSVTEIEQQSLDAHQNPIRNLARRLIAPKKSENTADQPIAPELVPPTPQFPERTASLRRSVHFDSIGNKSPVKQAQHTDNALNGIPESLVINGHTYRLVKEQVEPKTKDEAKPIARVPRVQLPTKSLRRPLTEPTKI